MWAPDLRGCADVSYRVSLHWLKSCQPLPSTLVLHRSAWWMHADWAPLLGLVAAIRSWWATGRSYPGDSNDCSPIFNFECRLSAARTCAGMPMATWVSYLSLVLHPDEHGGRSGVIISLRRAVLSGDNVEDLTGSPRSSGLAHDGCVHVVPRGSAYDGWFHR